MSGELRYRATHDALTGLVNRAEFEQRLRHALDAARTDDGQHTLLCIDLDQFKPVNDACGHSAGDQLLQQVSKMLKESVRAHDTVARLGGDEFAIILMDCGTQQAERLAQQICDEMDGFRFLHDSRQFRIGASIGLVPLDRRWSRMATAMQAADESCYAAKAAGRNRVYVWSDSDQSARKRHGETEWAARLECALTENQFVLHLQRIECIAQCNEGLHAEVLIRLVDADGSLIPPSAFLPAAERFHLLTRLEGWVLKHVLEQMLALPEFSALETLSLNLSGQSVGDRTFHRQVVEMLSNAGTAVCQRLCFEIAESDVIANMTDARVFIEQVRSLGVRIAVDDFGTAASSFGYLKTLRVDMLKFDGNVIRHVIDDPLDAAAVRCFVDVARVTDVKTVAKWVERPEILQRVREMGIDYAQGFHLHKPEPMANLFKAYPAATRPAA